jgi:hypothetical protein
MKTLHQPQKLFSRDGVDMEDESLYLHIHGVTEKNREKHQSMQQVIRPPEYEPNISYPVTPP